GQGGQMVYVLGGPATKMKWQAINCLYAGWRTLLTSADNQVEETAAWQVVWGRNEGDVALPASWPATLHQDPCETGIEDYRPVASPECPVAFTAPSLARPGPLGCDTAALPPVRTNWLTLAYGTFPAAAPDTIADEKPPPVPDDADGHYHGGRIDLAQTP